MTGIKRKSEKIKKEKQVIKKVKGKSESENNKRQEHGRENGKENGTEVKQKMNNQTKKEMKVEILRAMYYGKINELERARKPCEEDSKMFEAYEILMKTLTPEQVKLLDDYDNWRILCGCEDTEQAYERGVKTGFWLCMELKDFKPCFWEE